MSETNPIAFADDLSRVLSRYIATTLPISRRYPALAREFRNLLDEQSLVQGPYVEALPDFEKGRSLAEMTIAAGGFLHNALGSLPTSSRPLHVHQEDAIRRAVVDQQSFLTATGTGSGKTETFLYPIADALLKDPRPERPGVRALLVYPMNALANDQLYYRVAPLFARQLAAHGITFGRYTGQVKAKATRDEEEDRIWHNPKLMEALGNPSSIPRNWLLTRDEMLADPPKVLITNYAMLEHILLLPRNAGLFATNSLQFIVLDEIHTYYGAQATEVAFLLRKLKTRLGAHEGIRVFGTSASLSDSPSADEELKKFASDLFGEPVQAVVRGRRVAHLALTREEKEVFTLSLDHWQALGSMLKEFSQLERSDQTVDCWNQLLTSHGLPAAALALQGPGPDLAAPHLVGVFSRSKEVRSIAERLDRGRVVLFRHLAQQVFNDYPLNPRGAEAALTAVVHTGMIARRNAGEFPLLPGRYHLAVNSIEGVVALPSSSEEGWAKARVGRSYADETGHYYPLMTCRKCGQPFLEAWKTSTHVHPRRPDGGQGVAERIVFWLGKPIGGTQDEEDDVGDDQADGSSHERIFVNLKSGEIQASDEAVALFPVHTETDEVERAKYVKKCPACGGRSSGAQAEVVTHMHPGNESLGAVVAQRVLESLPEGVVDHSDPRPSFGRTLLTFSDNRQDAAFFAPYFERTSANVALRSAVRAVLSEATSAMPIAQVADRVFDHWQSVGGQALLVDSFGDLRSDRQDVCKLLVGALGYEFCTPAGRRNSLESLGVAQLTYDEKRLQTLYQAAKAFWPKDLPGDQESVVALSHMLLETIRRERALEGLPGVAMNDVSVWGDYNQHRTFDVETGDESVKFKWLPTQGANRHNRRTWYLVEQLGLGKEEAATFLRSFWSALTRPPTSLLKKYSPGFALDGALIRVKGGIERPLYQCSSCGLFQPHVLLKKCSAFRCRGDAVLLSADDHRQLQNENHYLATYAESYHQPVRAREHTASLSTSLREEIERDFSERRLNLLSCTTTMEMGVDLGDLEAVINLNVPPGIANYQQRTGRAGRRAQAAPVCVTVARNSNYDQSVFRELQAYLTSSPATPFVNLANGELFLRHQMSVILSHLLRDNISKQDINAPSLKHLFGEVLHEKAKSEFYERVFAWMEGAAGVQALYEAEALGNCLPENLQSMVCRGAFLKGAVVGRLREFAEDVAQRCQSYVDKKRAAAEADEMKKAAYWQDQLTKYMDQFLVNELSRRGLIPTYSFPVHSLTLEVQDGGTFNKYKGEADVALSRDASLGISEYAPGAEVVANGRIWESAGLASYPKAFMPTRWYAACPECFHVDVADSHQEVADACSNCGHADAARRKRMFLEPKGFVTSVADNKGRDPGSSRRRVRPADEARLIAAPRPEHFHDTELPFLQTALLLARGSDDSDLRGSLFVANRGAYGEGYYRCGFCNFCALVQKGGKKAAGKKSKVDVAAKKWVHKDPSSGSLCKQDAQPRLGLDFAHMFSTDVRLLRFLSPLPTSDDRPLTDRAFQEQVARTVAEALRLAASDMLHLHPGELRSTYRLYSGAGNRLEVVLYDGVPGGAGYSAKLGSPLCSYPLLLEAARRRLECPAECESACRSCLCDYGNQRYWDSFLRKESLAWLASLLGGSVAAAGPGNYVPWKKPSLAALNEKLAGFPCITALGVSLTGPSGYREADLNQLFSWLQAEKKVRLYVVNDLETHPKQYETLLVYRHLYPWMLKGRLRIFRLAEADGRILGELPRIFGDLEQGAPLVRLAFPVQPLLDGLIASPAEVGAVDDATKEIVERTIACATEFLPEQFVQGEQMSLWEFGVGDARPLPKIFAALQGAHIKRLAIRDPYCGTERNRAKLRQLLQFLKSHVSALPCIDVFCSEVKAKEKDGTDYVEHRYDVARSIEKILAELEVQSGEAFVKELGRNRTFHDRELTFEAVDSTGCDATHRYFLTGGIDYLLDERSDTKVFYTVLAK